MSVCKVSRTFGRIALIAFLSASLLGGLSLYAQESTITRLAVMKKAGAPYGDAIATVKRPSRVKGKVVMREKSGRIAKHALQAWPIMDGQGALLLLSSAKQRGAFPLRYYDVDTAKSRLLGVVPFSKATVVETKGPDEAWHFAISGVDPATKLRATFTGDTEAIHSRVDGASNPVFSSGRMSYHVAGGVKTISIARLTGQDLDGLILAPSSSANPSEKVAYLQFLQDGKSIVTDTSGQVDVGHWISNGNSLRVTQTTKSGRNVTTWRRSDLHPVSGIPASTIISVRLLEPLSSRTAKKGMIIKAVSTAPAISQGAILIPQGSEFDAEVVSAHGVGYGIRHETAALTLRFTTAILPDHRRLPIDAWVFKVDNAREKTSSDGKIEGVRSTGTIGDSVENKISSLAQIDPVAYIFLGAAGPAVLGFADPEILYDAGTDLLIQFHKPVITSEKYQPHVPRLQLSSAQSSQLNAMVKALPFRTVTEIGDKPSDITNLIFIGKPEALRRAFDAAGWTTSDQLTSASTFNTMKTLTGNETYKQAPMSMLILNHQKPLFTLQKTTNTFSSRHHVRVFPTKETLDGEPVLTASSTQDIGIAFSSRQRTFIHVIDQYLDNERSKILNDLDFTGCVESVDMVPRPWAPQNAYNSTGDRLRTDGRAAVLVLNDCAHPHATPSTVARRSNLFERSVRNTDLAIRDQLYRGNLVYQGISGGMKAHTYFATRHELGEEQGNWSKSDASGTVYGEPGHSGTLWTRPFKREPLAAEGSLNAAAEERVRDHKWDPPRFELALNLGYSTYRNNILETTIVELQSTDVDKPYYLLGLGDAVWDGWAAGVSLTVNTWNWVSNEFSYMRQQTKFDLVAVTVSSGTGNEADTELDVRTVGLVTRRAAYNTVFNLRPRKSRWRPYIAAGPVLQLVSLSDAPLKKPSGYFRLGLSNIGLIKAAFDFGNTPPLDGGGVFQLGVQYGGGIKYRVLPHMMIRGDYGETLAPNPSIIRDSYLGYIPEGLDDTYSTTVTNIKPQGKFIQQRATIGFAFTF